MICPRWKRCRRYDRRPLPWSRAGVLARFGQWQSGDGLIVRVRPRLGLFSLAQFAALAEVSARFGDGDLHLTSRANVQIRGVS